MILILGAVAYNFTSQGSLTNNDDDNKNGKNKTNNRFRLAKQNYTVDVNLFALVARPCDVKLPNLTFAGGRVDKNRKIHQHLTNWTTWDKSNKFLNRVNSLFKKRFCHRPRSLSSRKKRNLFITDHSPHISLTGRGFRNKDSIFLYHQPLWG